MTFDDWLVLVRSDIGFYNEGISTTDVHDLIYSSINTIRDAYNQGLGSDLTARLLSAYVDTDFHKEKL